MAGKGQLLSALIGSLLLVLLAFVEVLYADGNPCNTIASNTSLDKERIMCIGTLRTSFAKPSLLVVTDSLTVWRLEITSIDKKSLDATIDSLYFGKDEPKPIPEVWPDITKNSDYQKITKAGNKIVSCNPAIDSEGEYLLLDGNQTTGVIWDVNKNIGHTGYWNEHYDDLTMRWISSDEAGKMYAITERFEYLEIIQYSACNNDTKEIQDKFFKEDKTRYGFGFVNAKEGKCHPEEQTPPYRTLCLDGAEGVYVGEVNDTQCKRAENWHIFNGFVDHKHFYLFGKDHVITFKEDAYTSKSKSTIKMVPYDKFIKCSVNQHPRDFDAKKKSPLMIGLIVALVLILLICCLCILLCLVREAMARRKKAKKDAKNGKSHKGSAGKGGFFAPTTARSEGLLTPGALSKKFSAVSKRSMGGLTPGRKLTKRGSSMRTKRSSSKAPGGRSISRNGIPRTRRSLGPGSNSRRLTTAPGGGGASGASKAMTRRSKMTRAPSGGSKSRGRGASASRRGVSNHATERSRLKK